MKTNNLIVRQAIRDDFAEIIRIVEEITALDPAKKPQFNWDRYQIRDELQKSSTWVAVEDQSVSAFVCIRDSTDFYEITVLATAVRARNRGMQSHLMKAVLSKAKNENKNVLLEVHEENLSAIQFYRKHGFSELPSRKNYYTDGKNALVFIYRV